MISTENYLPTTAGCDEGNCVTVPSSRTNSEHTVERCIAGCGRYEYTGRISGQTRTVWDKANPNY